MSKEPQTVDISSDDNDIEMTRESVTCMSRLCLSKMSSTLKKAIPILLIDWFIHDFFLQSKGGLFNQGCMVWPFWAVFLWVDEIGLWTFT